MFQKELSRRDVVKGIAATGTSCVLAASPLALLSGCSAMPNSKQSYIHKTIKPENKTTVRRWTDIMLQAIRNQSFTPPQATRVFAMGHTAGFLAVNGIEGGYNTPYGLDKGPAGADAEVAYGVALSMALSEAMQSSFMFDRQNFLNQFPNSESKALGIQYGRYVAKELIKTRINDGAEPDKANFYLGRYPRRHDVLKWSPTGPFFGAEDAPFLGNFNRGILPGCDTRHEPVIN